MVAGDADGLPKRARKSQSETGRVSLQKLQRRLRKKKETLQAKEGQIGRIWMPCQLEPLRRCQSVGAVESEPMALATGVGENDFRWHARR